MAEPPAGTVVHAAVTDEPISVGDHEQIVAGPERGAVVGFGGVVRNHDHGREVTHLEYVGHPNAGAIIYELAAEAAARPGVAAVAVSHRLGTLRVGDTALACAVSAPHRHAAFDACAWLVDELKRRLPVWKHQLFADGTDEWVNCP